jgi:hypothetical protein
LRSKGKSSTRADRAARFAALTTEEKAQLLADVRGSSVWVTEDDRIVLRQPERRGIEIRPRGATNPKGRGF